MMRIVLCIVLAAALPGCMAASLDEQPKANAALDDVAVSTPPDDAATGSVMRAYKPATAYTSLPAEAGSPRSVSQKDFSDGIAQEIFYDKAPPGLKESRIELRVRLQARLDGDGAMPMEKPTEAGIRSELEAQFPRMPMQVVERPMRNAYGEYGLAVGKWANGARCIYAWQWIDSIGNDRNPASVRVRLCRMDASLDQMAALVDGLRIAPGPYARLEPVAVAPVAAAPPSMPKPKKHVEPAPERKRSRPIVRNVGAPATVASPPEVASAGDGDRPAPLDPSLPAAAYRGPPPPVTQQIR